MTDEPRTFNNPPPKVKDDIWADNIHLTQNEHTATLKSHQELLKGKFIEFITHAENQKRSNFADNQQAIMNATGTHLRNSTKYANLKFNVEE